MSSIELISADGDGGGGISNSSDESPDSIKARDATKRLALLFHEKQTELARAAEKIKHLEAALEASEDRIAAATSSQSGPRGGPASLASRKVIEELSKENARLQATLRNSKANAAGEDWILVTGELRRENANLRSKLKTTQTALDSINPDPNDETQSAGEIIRLSSKLVEMEDQLKVKNALIEGLSTHLAETQKRVEKLDFELRDARAAAVVQSDANETTQLKAEIETTNKKLRKAEDNVAHMQKALEQTQLEKTQAIEVTHSWDAYCKEQDKIIRNLEKECAKLKGQVDQLQVGKESRKRDVERILLSAKQLVDKERKDRIRAQAATKRAQEQFELLEGKYRLLEHNFKIESDRRTTLEEELGQRRDDRERFGVLEQQVVVYKEDFETERRDRERIQAECEELNEQLKECRKRIRTLEDERRQLTAAAPPLAPSAMAESRRSSVGGGGATAMANYPLSSYEHKMVLQHQQRIENQIKKDRASSQRRMSPHRPPPDVESDLVPRSLTQHLGPSGDVQMDSSFTTLTTHSQPITQPTADSDEEQMSMFGGSRSVIVPRDPFEGPSVPLRMGSLSAPPVESLKNSQAPQRKGRGNELVCPRCSAAFAARDGATYIEHVDKCCSLGD